MDKLYNFIERPYSDEMTALDWALFLGFCIAITALWTTMLNHIKGAF